MVKHCTTQHKEKSNDKNGIGKKKRREHCTKIELVPAQKRKKGKRNIQKQDPILERGGKSVHVHTLLHARHFPDLPFGEITIEGTSFTEHYTTTTKKSTKIKMGWKKKGEKASFKNRVSAATQKEEGEKKQPEKIRS